ncbi:MAG: hypothetical protein Q9169_006613 [Polycauliona sp. 2 TL-2023]
MAHQPGSSAVVPNLNYERPRTAETPSSRALPRAIVNIKHPGYEEHNLLMRFNAFDRLQQRTGIHYGTVLTACTIFSGHNNGFLSGNPDGPDPGQDFNSILEQGSYHFVVPGDKYYAIYPSFQYSNFPHHHLPRGWSNLQPIYNPTDPAPARSNTTGVVVARDQECLVGGPSDIMERAHLCPQKETTWFTRNDMDKYNQSVSHDYKTDDLSNLITLRKDIHIAFDRRMFVFMPKQGKWLVHFLEPSRALGPFNHNVSARMNGGIAQEHVLARFAWAIFPMVATFLKQGSKRWIRALVTDENGAKKEENTYISGSEITQRYFPSRTRSNSPQKRARPADDDDDDDDDEIAEDVQNRKMRQGTYKRTKMVQPSKLHNESARDMPRVQKDAVVTSPQDPSTSPLPPTSERDLSIPTTKDIMVPSNYQDDGIEDPDPRVHFLYSTETPLDRLRRLELKRRRPYYNPSLFCCDYDKRTAAVHAAIKEEGKWNKHELCYQCLGGEYQLRAADLDKAEEIHEG